MAIKILKHQEEKEAQPEGEVVCILQSATKTEFPGFLEPASVAGFKKFVPLDTRAPFGLLRTTESKGANDDILVISYNPWNATEALPQCTFLRTLGSAGSLEVQTQALLLKHEIYQTDVFPDAVNQQMATFSEEWKISEQEMVNRRDCRADCVVSIDPSTARDLDDALSIKSVKEGYEIAVHIADVAHFVPPNSPLDLEAQERCTTVYLTQKSIPMLPRILSSDLCSLNPGEDRLAVSVIFTLSPDAQLVGEPWFGRTVIRSCCKLNYDAAQDIINAKAWVGDTDIIFGGFASHDVAGDLLLLHWLAQKLRAKRFEDGSLRLNKVKLSVRLDENNRPSSVEAYPYRDSNELVEEYMLVANQVVAKQLFKSFPDLALLRRHPAPEPTKSKNISTQLKAAGFPDIPASASRDRKSVV